MMSFLLGTLLLTVGSRTCHITSRRISRAMSISCAMICQPTSARASRCRHAVLPTRAARSNVSARASVVATAVHIAAAIAAPAHPVIAAATIARATAGHPTGSVEYATTVATIYAPAAARAYRRHCCCCVPSLFQRLIPSCARTLRRVARLRRLQLPFHLSDVALNAAHHASWEQVLPSSCVVLVVAGTAAAARVVQSGGASIITFGVGE